VVHLLRITRAYKKALLFAEDRAGRLALSGKWSGEPRMQHSTFQLSEETSRRSLRVVVIVVTVPSFFTTLLYDDNCHRITRDARARLERLESCSSSLKRGRGSTAVTRDTSVRTPRGHARFVSVARSPLPPVVPFVLSRERDSCVVLPREVDQSGRSEVEICVTAASVSRAHGTLPPSARHHRRRRANSTNGRPTNRALDTTGRRGATGKGGKGAPYCLSFECFRTSA